MSIIFDTPEGIRFVQLAARKGALGLELKGMRRSRGRSAYSICKSEYGLRGSRERVYAQMCELVEAAIAAKHAADREGPEPHEHEVDHNYCDRDDHLRRRETGEDCPLRVCYVCGMGLVDPIMEPGGTSVWTGGAPQ